MIPMQHGVIAQQAAHLRCANEWCYPRVDDSGWTGFDVCEVQIFDTGGETYIPGVSPAWSPECHRCLGLGGDTTMAYAVNNNGDVAGLSTDPSGVRHAVRWRSGAAWAVEDLGTLGGCCSEGYGINTFGDVVGVSSLGKRTQQGFLARPGALMMNLALRSQSSAQALNDFGAIVGTAAGGRGDHAVLWRVP
jgi:probable HAF family extracellular repeat protein